MIDLEAIRLRVWLQRTSSPPDPTLALKQATVDIPALLARVEELTQALERALEDAGGCWSPECLCAGGQCELCDVGRVRAVLGLGPA